MSMNKQVCPKDKLKLARRMMTPAEVKAHVSPFQCAAWEAQKDATDKKIKAKIAINRLKKLKEKMEVKT